nr:MAG TPA: hypothetical protein [Caudoviricetes sp.]
MFYELLIYQFLKQILGGTLYVYRNSHAIIIAHIYFPGVSSFIFLN